MRDAAGEPADGLQLLRVKELLLEPLDAGHVLDQAEDAGDAAVGFVQRRGDQVHRHRRAVLLLSDHLDGGNGFALHHPTLGPPEFVGLTVHGG